MAKINKNSTKNNSKSKNNINNRPSKKPMADKEPIREDIVLGRNGVIEALKAKITVEQILVSKGEKEGSIVKIMALAKEKGVVIKEVDRKRLDSLSQGETHQGVVAIVTPFRYSEIPDILDKAKEKGEAPFIIILDEIEDPHNLGSIIRTAELCGAHGIVIPKRRNVGVTPTVYKTSAGAVNYMKIAKVSNINNVIDELKKENIWIYGADGEAENFSYNVDFKGAVALVIGSEGRGISKLTREKCDVMVRIPMVGKVNSLNASVAGGILMYEVLKSRL